MAWCAATRRRFKALGMAMSRVRRCEAGVGPEGTCFFPVHAVSVMVKRLGFPAACPAEHLVFEALLFVVFSSSAFSESGRASAGRRTAIAGLK